MGIRIDEATCIGCGLCEISCAYKAIHVHIKARVDNDKCTDCTVCLDYCPVDAISMERAPAHPSRGPGEASFDVVVIGSGVGGMCAAALLAHRGYRTLLLERMPSVGGRYSSLRHDGVIIPTGGSLITVGGPLHEVCWEVGAPFEVVEAGTTRYWVKGKGWIEPDPGPGQFRSALAKISGDPDTAAAVTGSMRSIIRSRDFPPGTVMEWLSGVTDNREIKEVFRAFVGANFGPDDVPAADFFGLYVASAGKHFGLARYGGLHIMQGLAKAIRRAGGEVWTRAEAKSILLEEGKAAGVLVEREGQPWRVKARVFISNAGPQQTVRLVGPENLDPQYLAYVDERVRPMAGITVHLISDRSLLGGFQGSAFLVGTRRLCIAFDTTAIAGWSPPGRHMTEVYPYAGSDPDEVPDWEGQIEEAAHDLDEVFPGWRDCSEMKVVICQGEYPGLRTWIGLGVSVETPIPNLFLVGDGCEGRGYAGGQSAAETGQRVAALVQERFPR